MEDDRLAHARGMYFHQAVCLFPIARGFFKWPAISAQTFSAIYFYCNITAPILLIIIRRESCGDIF